jgi:putative DNA primase/helicase
MNTIERATGRWREILPQLGISPRFLVNRHGPCPLCGGKDRFRWDDRDGTGSFYCNQCGPGPGLNLVRKLNSWDYATACRAVDEIIGQGPASPRRDPPSSPGAGRRLGLEKMLAEARDQDLVGRYLAGRGLSTVLSVLRGHHRLAYMDGERFIGHYPAMVAPVLGADGSLQSVHRTYLADVPTRKKLMPPVETVQGAAVRLFEATQVLGIAEGVETAIAAYELFGLPTWAVISTAGMESFGPPDGVQRLTVFADHDANFAGQKAAFNLAHRLHRDRLTAVDVKIPPMPDTDWLDVLIDRRAAA